MENIYSVIENKKESNFTPAESFDVEAWKAKKQQQREDTFALTDTTATRVNSDARALSEYLDTMARLPERTASNTLLIYAQRPSATRVGDKEYWANEHASIKRGEKGIAILEQGDAYVREDGSRGTFFEVTHVFDESQTTARKLHPRRYLEANVVVALAKTAIPRIEAVDNLEGELAVYDHDTSTVYLQKGLTQTQVFWALTTELAHAEFARGQSAYSRDAHQERAELSATVLAKRYGIEVPPGDLPAPASPGAEPKDIRAALAEVQKAVKAITRQAARELDRPKEREQAMSR